MISSASLHHLDSRNRHLPTSGYNTAMFVPDFGDRSGAYPLVIDAIITPTTRIVAIYTSLLNKAYIVNADLSLHSALLAAQSSSSRGGGRDKSRAQALAASSSCGSLKRSLLPLTSDPMFRPSEAITSGATYRLALGCFLPPAWFRW
jgi:hypothetical protein